MMIVAILLSVFFISVSIALYLNNRELRKISLFTNTAQKISRGQLDVRLADTFSSGKLGELALSFDTIAEKMSSDALLLSCAYEAQRTSEKKYLGLDKRAGSIIMKVDVNYNITFFNEYAECFFGFSEPEIVGRSILGTIIPDIKSTDHNLTEAIQKVLADPYAHTHIISENTRVNGESVWIAWSCHPLKGSDGKTEEVMSVGLDITERKRIELEYLKNEQRFRHFVENVNDVLFALTPSGVFSYISPQWKESFGYELNETIGQPFTPYVHPDDVQGCIEFMKKVFETGKKHSGVEYRVRRKDGTYLWYKANASLTINPANNMPTLVGIGRDITELKQAEKTLRQSEEIFSAVFRASPDAIALSRLSDGIYQMVNEGFTNLTGYSQEEALGRSSSELQLWIDPEQKELFLKQLHEQMITKNVETRFNHKDGSILLVQISARIIEVKGEPHALCITRDITEREHVQKELLKAQKLESISVLAGGIAHNFNNVLTGVIGYISFAKKHLSDTDKVLNLLEAAEKSSYRAADLARQLLKFSQGSPPDKKPVRVDTLVQESVSLFLSGTNVKGIIDCSTLKTVNVDSQQINQAFNNIVLNALQAMPDGGTLTVLADIVKLKAGNKYALKPESYVRIAFEDTGYGIEKKDLAKIFDPYFTTKENGTGIGLSTTHSIISRHGGSINITSKIGRGTTATIFLPTSTEKDTINAQVQELTEIDQTGVSILVMDDEKMIRDLADEILQDLGYEVTTCSDGEMAIDLFKDSIKAGSPYSIVLMDLIIPGGMGGIETARQILNLAPQARLIASSGYPDDPAISEYDTYGFCETIVKPYNTDELSRVLQSVLSESSCQ